MLCLQNIGNLYRKNAFKCLLDKDLQQLKSTPTTAIENEPTASASSNPSLTDAAGRDVSSPFPAAAAPATAVVTAALGAGPEEALQVFDESIDFSLEAGVPDPVPFEQRLRDMLDSHEPFLHKEQHAIGHRYRPIASHPIP